MGPSILGFKFSFKSVQSWFFLLLFFLFVSIFGGWILFAPIELFIRSISPLWDSSYSGTACQGSGWLTGRYRKLYSQFLLPKGLRIPLIISEAGIDCGTCSVTKCSCSGGWKNACPQYWNGGQDCNAEYMKELTWYDQVLRCDDYVLGATVFALEIPGNWGSFEIAPLSDLFATYLSSQ